MKRIVLAALAAGAFAGAGAPALAQDAAAAARLPLAQRAAWIDHRIDQAEARGTLSKLQARDLRSQLQGLQMLEEDYRKTGLTAYQKADLDARYETLEARLQVNSHPASLETARRATEPPPADEDAPPR